MVDRTLWVVLGLCGLWTLGVLVTSGCGKTVDQATRAVHALVEIPVKAYEDGKENVQMMKESASGPQTTKDAMRGMHGPKDDK